MLSARASTDVAVVTLAFLLGGCGARHAAPERDSAADDDVVDEGDSGRDADTDRDEADTDIDEFADGEDVDADPGDDLYDIEFVSECRSYFDVYRGDVAVRSARDMWELAGYGRIRGSVTISSPTLTGLDGFFCLSTVEGDLEIIDNDGLESLFGFIMLGTVGGDLVISGNDRIMDLHGLRSLFGIGGVLIIGGPSEGDGNERLESLRGLAVDVVGGIVVEGNPALREVRAFETVGRYGGTCDLTVRNNPSLTSLFDDGGMISIAAGIVIEDNVSLVDTGERMLEGLVEGSVIVRRNPLLSSLAGFSRVIYVGGDLVIESTGLTGLDDLDRLAVIGGPGLVLSDNPELPTCEAESLRDRFVDFGWSGAATIEGNDDGGVCE